MGSTISSLAGMAGSVLGNAFGGGRGATKGEDKAEWISDVNTQQQQALDAIYKGLTPQNTEFGKQLAEGALGRGPSIAEMMLKANNERTLAQQLSAAKANRAVNPALAARNLSNAATQQNMNTAQQGAIARLQEQRQQQQAFADYLNNNLRNQQAFLGGGLAAGQAQTQAANTRLNANAQQGAAIGKGISDAIGAGVGGFMGGGDSGKMEGALNDAFSTGRQIEGTPNVGSGYDGVEFMAAHGGKVPGKPKVKGDSPSNDTVHAKLSPGEIVVPRTVAAKSPEAIMAFIEAAKKSAPKKKENFSFGGLVAAKEQLKKAKGKC